MVERVFVHAPDSYMRHRLSGMRAMEVKRRKFIAECETVVVSDPPTAEEKERTRQMTTKARKWKILEQKPCERCGTWNSDAHHPDYGKPLLVRWLCMWHHMAEHRRLNGLSRR
jgi:hypothetical protein